MSQPDTLPASATLKAQNRSAKPRSPGARQKGRPARWLSAQVCSTIEADRRHIGATDSDPGSRRCAIAEPGPGVRSSAYHRFAIRRRGGDVGGHLRLARGA